MEPASFEEPSSPATGYGAHRDRHRSAHRATQPDQEPPAWPRARLVIVFAAIIAGGDRPPQPPIATTREHADFTLDALFTATSAVLRHRA